MITGFTAGRVPIHVRNAPSAPFRFGYKYTNTVLGDVKSVRRRDRMPWTAVFSCRIVLMKQCTIRRVLFVLRIVKL